MPAVSKAQQRLMGACSHGAQYASCPKDMSKKAMRDFASTKLGGLPARRHMSPAKRVMRDRSTKGSPPFEMPEFRRGYRAL